MTGTRRGSHTLSHPPSQGVLDSAASNKDTVLRLLAEVTVGRERVDSIHAIRTHCRRLQALLELCGEAKRAREVAVGVSRLSRLRALQVFRQYLVRCDATQKDLTLVDDRLAKQTRKLQRTEAYQKIERVVLKLALQRIASPVDVGSRRLDARRHAHERQFKELIVAASDKPRRKRLHALRLALKTIRYQMEWLPGRTAATRDLLSRLKRVQTILGTYEELADFRRWGKPLSRPVQQRITKDWKRARKRARHVPDTLQWLLDALASGQVWSVEGLPVTSVHRKSTGLV